MFAKRITALFVFGALLFAPSALSKPMPALPSGLAARANHNHMQAARHATKLMSTYKGHHVGAAKRAAKAKSVAHLLHREQDVDVDVNDTELAMENTVGEDTEDADASAEGEAGEGKEAAPTGKQGDEDDDAPEQAAEYTTDSYTDGAADVDTDVEDSTETAEGDVAKFEDAALKGAQDTDEVDATEDALEDVSEGAADDEDSIEGDVVDAEEATLEEKEDADASIDTAEDGELRDNAKNLMADTLSLEQTVASDAEEAALKQTSDAGEATLKQASDMASTISDLQGNAVETGGDAAQEYNNAASDAMTAGSSSLADETSGASQIAKDVFESLM